jgi:hypothetical protein
LEPQLNPPISPEARNRSRKWKADEREQHNSLSGTVKKNRLPHPSPRAQDPGGVKLLRAVTHAARRSSCGQKRKYVKVETKSI